MFGPFARGVKFEQGAVDQRIGGGGRARGFGPVADAGGSPLLVFHLVQLPARGCGVIQARRQHQHRHRIRIGLPHRGHDIAQSGSGDDIADPDPSGGARIAVGHEPCPLFVPRKDMGQAGLLDAAIHFLIMHPRDAKDHLDPARFQHMRDLGTKGALRHQGLQNERVKRTSTAIISSRPISMAAANIHFAVSLSPA